MISITKLNNMEVIINCELIESIEATPDSTISMTTGKKFIAKESIDVIIEKVIAFKRRINTDIK
ncbi:MAG: flagellar FlbD family protein [Clostridiales bacterium]|jgi:flagellar protein FlbD|nr:flagellar FlbD family protein [Clostridiales bacterium]